MTPFVIATPFVGRQGELQRIAELNQNPVCRLLTLVGPGGIGKTRLALEAAQRLPGGLHFVPLQPVISSDFLVSAIADALGLRLSLDDDPKGQLLAFLSDRSWRLVLDNFEHLLDGTALLSEILAAAPHIRLLVTSRERLNLVEEWVLEVEGLPYPSSATDTTPEHNSAVELFVQQAQRVKSTFTLTEMRRSAVIRICRLVGGMPLGIELAARWVRALSCEAIAKEIERGLDILGTPARNVEPRHRTMRAAFTPTWARLSDVERTVFMRLSVFRAGFTREAAEAVAGTSLETLAILADKSLLRLDADGRYDVHELLRQYGDEQLEASGMGAEIHDAHSAYYAEFVFARVEDLKGRRQPEALREIQSEFENVRTAWNWAASHKSRHLIERMTEGLDLFCGIRSRDVDARALFKYAEQQFSADRDGESEHVWGRVLARSAEGGSKQTNLVTALEIARRYNDRLEIGSCLEELNWVAYQQQDYETAKQLIEQSIACYRDLGDRYYEARALYALRRSDPEVDWESYKQIAEECLRIRRAINDKAGIAAAVVYAAVNSLRMGNFTEAEKYWNERISLGQEVGSLGLVALGYAHLSYSVYFILGEFAQARTAAEQAIQLGDAIGFNNSACYASTTLGLLASMEEDYQAGKLYCQQAVAISELVWMKDLAAWGSSVAACGLGDYRAAREYLLTASKFMLTFFGLPGLVAMIGIGAVLLAQVGESTHAVEWLAFAFTHPVGASGWLNKWPLLTRLRTSLEADLGSDAHSGAWERGRRLEVEVVTADLKRLIQVARTMPNSRLAPLDPEALTERELEILRLIATGLTNSEIGERLFIGVSTVKKHINHIYDKLNTKNRTQAVARARDLRVLT